MQMANQGLYNWELTNYEGFRKPKTGMWDLMVAEFNDGIQPDKDKCFFVGDASGGPNGPAALGDSDRKFAENIGIAFRTPEEEFGGEMAMGGDEAWKD